MIKVQELYGLKCPFCFSDEKDFSIRNCKNNHLSITSYCPDCRTRTFINEIIPGTYSNYLENLLVLRKTEKIKLRDRKKPQYIKYCCLGCNMPANLKPCKKRFKSGRVKRRIPKNPKKFALKCYNCLTTIFIVKKLVPVLEKLNYSQNDLKNIKELIYHDRDK